MKYLIVFCICLLATMKVSFQSSFAKKEVKTVADSVFFNCLIFLSSSLIFIPYIARAVPIIWGYAAAFAVLTVAFQLAYTGALSQGNVSIAVMFANFGMLVPVLLSIVLFGEKPSVMRMIGILLVICCFIITAKPSGGVTKRSLLLCIVAMIANGGVSAVQKLFAATEYSTERFTFVSASYLLSTLLAASIYIVLAFSGRKKTFRLGKHCVIAALLTGVTLGTFLALNTYAAATIDGTFLFPAHSGGAIILSTLSGIIFFHDKLSVRQIVALCLGTTSIVLMNF